MKLHLSRNTLKFWFPVLLCVLCIVSSPAVSAPKFYSINSLFGISSRAINSICKDDNGFIWAASKTGILRLTNNSYHIYALPYETTGAVVVTLNYSNSKLVAFTNNGQVFSYNSILDRFELMINLRKSFQDEDFDLYGLLPDRAGNYWISLKSGLYKYAGGKLSLVAEISKERYLVTWYDDKKLVVAGDSKIWLFDTQTSQREYLYAGNQKGPARISKLFFDKSRRQLWLGTFSDGLFCFDFQTKAYLEVLSSSFPKQPILDIEEISESAIMVGVDGQGVWEIDKNTRSVRNVYKEDSDDPYSLRGNGVYDIFCEPGKRVWVCTVSRGISFFYLTSPLVNQLSHRTNDPNSLVNNDVNGVLEDRRGKIWFATNNGISCWNPRLNHWKSFYFNKLKQAQVFLTLCEDNEGRIWAGSYSSGVYVLDGDTGKELAHYSDGSPVGNFIFDIFKDSDGDIWVGVSDGKLPCYNTKEGKFISYSEVPISAFAESSSGQLILAGSYGFRSLNKKTGEISNLLPGHEIQDFIILGENLWAGTSGEGLLEYNMKTGTTQKYTAKEGLPSDFVNSVAFADGSLWLGTENGLCRFDPKSATAVTFPSILPFSGLSYNKSAFYQLKNGQLACGTNNGVVMFDPRSIKNIGSSGRIFLQNLNIAGRSIREIPSFQLDKPIDSLQTVSLKYSQNTISLELISFGTGSRFSWKLEGFDKDWSQASENRFIAYTNLPSGDFKLKIRLFNSSSSTILAERLLEIRVVPPFWNRWWFWLLVILVISSVTALYLLYYINRLKQQHTEEKVRFFTNTAHDIRTSLTLIKAPVEELNKEKGLTDSGKRYLKLATEYARQLTAVVNQLIDFQKADIGKERLSLAMADLVKFVSDRRMLASPYAESRNITLQFVPDCETYVTAFDEQKLEKIVDNLISNAIKYSHSNSEVLITLRCSEREWTLVVKDQGIGISRKAQRQLFREFYRGENAINSKVVGSGIGLLLVRNYVTLHGGKITCESEENAGSVFQVTIPFKSVQTDTIAATESLEQPNIGVVNEIVELPVIPENDDLLSEGMKVLIVEDNDDLLNFLKSALSDYFKVFTAADGEEGWSFVSKHLPDLVVSDVMMPKMDGFELCRLIKSTYETSHIPLVLLTALSEKTDQLQGLGLGADDYLTKPFDMTILVQRIRSIIRNREIVREKAIKSIKEKDSVQILPNRLNDDFIRRITEVAQANLANAEFSKEDFASALNVSNSLLYKKIKSLTDQSPTDFIKTVRLNRAMELLKTGEHTVTEVSELCGFTSLTYFGIVFKKHFGKSPSEVLE